MLQPKFLTITAIGSLLKNEKKFLKDLQLLAKDEGRREVANSYIDSLIMLIREGRDEKELKKEAFAAPITFEGAYEVAKARISVDSKFSKWNSLWLDSYSASYSTPEIVGNYRANRIGYSELVDLGCGAGLQSIFFANWSRVTAIEVSPLRTAMAKLNFLAYERSAERILNADYTSVIDGLKIGPQTVVFSDPLRPKAETERTLGTLLPSPDVVRKLLAGKTERFVFDLPPQMRWSNIPLEGEKEYISVSGSLNRLTVYQGDLASDNTSAVMLPRNSKVSGNPKEHEWDVSDNPGKFILLPDPSLLYSKLAYQLKGLGDYKIYDQDNRRMVLTSEEKPDSFFPGEVFEVNDVTDWDNLTKTLKGLGSGRVIPRYQIAPENYYKLREVLEKGLSGDIEIYIFKKGNEFTLASKDKTNDRKKEDGTVVKKLQ